MVKVHLDMLTRRFWSAPAEEVFTDEEEEERPEVGDLVTLQPENKQMGILKALEGTRAEALGDPGCDFNIAAVIYRLHDVSAIDTSRSMGRQCHMELLYCHTLS